jgi:hypothetical protein
VSDPSHRAYSVIKREGKEDFWHNIGVVFPHGDGEGFSNKRSLNKRPHDIVVQTRQKRREGDALQGCHWTISLLKCWLLGTHAGAVRDKHLQAYLDEFAFRHNRRKTNGTLRIAAASSSSVVREPLPMHKLINETRPCRWFASCVDGATASSAELAW